MSQQTLLDNNRRDLILTESKVKDILPSYYASDYPDLIKFLEYYYDWLDSDLVHGFDTTIKDLYKLRDLRETELSFLNQVFYEIGQGLVSADYFLDPKLISGLLANFYRIKGSLYSAEGFFRAFYREQPQIIYPKNSLFIVGQSQIGPESLKIIQDGALYQVLSVLVRSGVPISEWRDLYKAFVHPAGFFLGGEVIIESLGNLNLGIMPNVILDSAAGVWSLEGVTSFLEPTALTSITLIYNDEGDADAEKERLVTDTIRKYTTLTVSQLNTMYNDIEDVIDANAPRFDEDSNGTIKAIKFSNTLETMDENMFDGFGGTLIADSNTMNYVFDTTIHTMDDIRKTLDLDSSRS
jgi:hypothetical protein